MFQKAVAKRLIVLMSLVGTAALSQSAAVNPAGTYSKVDTVGSGQMVIEHVAARNYRASFRISRGACAGEIPAVLGDSNGRVLTFRMPIDNQRRCDLAVTPAGSSMLVQEQGTCAPLRGTSCSFSGTYRSIGAATERPPAGMPSATPQPDRWTLYDGSRAATRARQGFAVWLNVSCLNDRQKPYLVSLSITDPAGNANPAQRSGFRAIVRTAGDRDGIPAVLLAKPSPTEMGSMIRLSRRAAVDTDEFFASLSAEEIASLKSAAEFQLHMVFLQGNLQNLSVPFDGAGAGAAIGGLRCERTAATPTRPSATSAPSWAVGDVIDTDFLRTHANGSGSGWRYLGGSMAGQNLSLDVVMIAARPTRYIAFLSQAAARNAKGGFDKLRVISRLELTAQPGEEPSFECPPPNGQSALTLVNERTHMARAAAVPTGTTRLIVQSWRYSPRDCEMSAPD